MPDTSKELAALLALPDFSAVYREADRVRHERVGDTVHIRAILEFSNHCRRRCRYCGLNAENETAVRYRMTTGEMLATARAASDAGYRTLVMQSGEDGFFTAPLLAEIIREVKKTGMAVTVSCGEFSDADYAILKDAGADRYLLKHETSDPRLYSELHPCGNLDSRLRCLRTIKRLGLETGGGFMIGLPGQTLETIANDLLLLRELRCDMAGIGPFIPHPSTPLRSAAHGATELTKRAVALARLLMPNCNLPATTALGVLESGEKNDVFSCGANVIMHKVTPAPYRAAYEIYPSDVGKADIPAERAALEAQIKDLGKIPL